MIDWRPRELSFTDSGVRQVRESDIPGVIRLFELNYGTAYPAEDVYDGTWIKRCIYGDSIIGLVIEDSGVVAASGALMLNLGDYNDRNAELARLVVHPDYRGRGLGHRLVEALIETSDDSLDYAEGHARTAHKLAQHMMEASGFRPLGYLPQYFGRESLVCYGRLFGNACRLRGTQCPEVIPEAIPLARHVLRRMDLPDRLRTYTDPPDSTRPCKTWDLEPLNARLLDTLLLVEQDAANGPYLFGNLSLDQGIAAVRQRRAAYMVAIDKQRTPVGAIGFQATQGNRVIRAFELMGADPAVRGFLCSALVTTADQLGAVVIETNVSAYHPKLQRTFWNLGFRPVAYAPALAFHQSNRLDSIRMVRLNTDWIPLDPAHIRLTDEAAIIAEIVRQGFLGVPGRDA